MDGVGSPYLLLPGGESPHAYSLQPLLKIYYYLLLYGKMS
jgi:hypothetical protein